MNKYDLAIIGSGPCGYAAAVKAARSGMKVCVFEKDRIGGVCLNWGCIPAKTLSASARILSDIKRSSEFGVNIKEYSVDYDKVQARKDQVIKKLASGIEMLFKTRKIEVIKEKAVIKNKGSILAGSREISSKNILIAAGSLPFEVPGISFDGIDVLSSTDALSLKAVPKSILIIGGGVIGCEFASILRTFGSEIVIVEMTEQLLPNEDAEISRKLEEVFKKRGISIYTGTKVESIEKKKDFLKAILSRGIAVDSEKALVCVGRSPNSKDLGLEEIGISSDRGWINVDENYRTDIDDIYAAGDVKGGMLLAHVASREGICAVEAMLGKKTSLDYGVVPNCIFTEPEIASVGLSEKAAKTEGLNARSRKFLFSAIGKAHVIGETEGFIKMVVNNDDDRILGAQIIGPHATELIAEISPCVQLGITSEKLAGVIHAHPTLSEAIQEVAEAARTHI